MEGFLIETSRLRLREWEPGDAESLYLLNADPEVIRYTGDQPFSSVGAAQAFLENYDEYRQQGFGRWAVIRKEDGEFLGWCGLKRHPEFVDLGFRFFRQTWGLGYATESARAVVEYAFSTLDLPRLVGRAARENPASLRVLEKLGMRYWKEDRCHGIDHAQYYRLDRKHCVASD